MFDFNQLLMLFTSYRGGRPPLEAVHLTSSVEWPPVSLPTSESIWKPVTLDFALQGRGSIKCEIGEPVTIVAGVSKEVKP